MENENRSQKIAVTGATGRVGSLVEILEQRGHDVVPIARSKGVDVVSGEGLEEALAGVETIIDTATGPSPDQEEATAFFTASARNLSEPARQPGRSGSSSSRSLASTSSRAATTRRRSHRADAAQGPLPLRIVRAAQFHEFVEQLVGWTMQDGVAYLPEDAARRRSGRLRSPRRCGRGAEIENGRITEVAGPREERLADAAAALFASRGDSFEIREVRQPGDPDGVAYAEGAALPNPGAKLAGPSFEEWLAAA